MSQRGILRRNGTGENWGVPESTTIGSVLHAVAGFGNCPKHSAAHSAHSLESTLRHDPVATSLRHTRP